MIKRLLDGFDLAGRPLLFYVGSANFRLLCALRDGSGSIILMWQGATSGSAICAHIANRRKYVRGFLRRLRGVLRVVYLDVGSTRLFCGVRACLEELRLRSPRQRVSASTTVENWTACRC